MKHSLMQNMKRAAAALASLFAVASLPACFIDLNDCDYEVGYIVCDDGVEFVQNEYCTPYQDWWGNWYEDCTYDGYYQQRCWQETRCSAVPECRADTDCAVKGGGYGTCSNGRCSDRIDYKPDSGKNSNTGSEVSCTQDSDCLASNMAICVDYGSKKICASQCFNDTQCQTNYHCEFLSNDLSTGACLTTSYPCNANEDCPSGMVCQSHMCLVSCSSNDDCQSGNASFACVNNSSGSGYCNTLRR